jgi:DNA-binding NarL/FixJ family response regulator
MCHFRTLVVDDIKYFRRFLCSTLEQRTECEVVGEASDGLEAVAQAELLQPDLILLDLGLPTINGIEAARRIRKLSPNSKILFFTQNCSHEIAQAALRTGANGYLLKSDATDLRRAVETVLSGELFVSSRVKITSLIDLTSARGPASLLQ